MTPGEYRTLPGEIEINSGRVTVQVIVIHKGDRPIQVGSHFHFYEVNKSLEFDRVDAFGKRLNIPAGTAVRFEPGEEKPIELVEFGGNKHIYGFSGLTSGPLEPKPPTEQLKQTIETWKGA